MDSKLWLYCRFMALRFGMNGYLFDEVTFQITTRAHRRENVNFMKEKHKLLIQEKRILMPTLRLPSFTLTER